MRTGTSCGSCRRRRFEALRHGSPPPSAPRRAACARVCLLDNQIVPRRSPGPSANTWSFEPGPRPPAESAWVGTDRRHRPPDEYQHGIDRGFRHGTQPERSGDGACLSGGGRRWEELPRAAVMSQTGPLCCLRAPLCGRMLRDIEMPQPAPPVAQHHEHKQHSKSRGRDREEIQRDQILGVVLQKRAPHL